MDFSQAIQKYATQPLTHQILLSVLKDYKRPRSQKNAFTYLLEELRISEDNLKNFNTRKMVEWVPDAPKKASLVRLLVRLKSSERNKKLY